MDFYAILDQVIALLRQRQRVTYRALQRQFGIDDTYLEDLKAELIDAQRLAVDEEGKVLVWMGDPALASPAVSAATEASHQAPLTYTPSYLAEKILTSCSALQGERKQVTVLFADIKDSTELIRDLDPEDAQKLLDPAIHLMMEAVHRFEGTVNQVLSDGIMSIFGAPIAHEDHALRACYAALAMQTAMRNYTEDMRRTYGIPLQIRAGLNSGEVVVRTISSDLHMDYSAVGQATHLAARMEQLATPGSIILSRATLRLVEGLVQVNALGPIPVKGMTEPVEVFELTGASSIRRRLQAAVARGLTKFVGRDTEIETLNQALEQTGSGHGQIVAAVGEAGVGKSRLVYEFVHSHRTQGWRVLESASVSYGKATPYFPIIDLFKRYVHVEEGDDARFIRAKVTGHILTLDETLQETIPVLLFLLDALSEDSPFLQLDPSQRRQHTLEGLKRILLRESQVQPLLLVFEDLHWIDSETQALLDSLVESLPTAQLLLLVNYRPEYQHTWGSKTYYTQLRLDPLPPESAVAFLEALLGDDASLEPLKTLLIERTERPF
jgi:class 3 adenylate cyclase